MTPGGNRVQTLLLSSKVMANFSLLGNLQLCQIVGDIHPELRRRARQWRNQEMWSQLVPVTSVAGAVTVCWMRRGEHCCRSWSSPQRCLRHVSQWIWRSPTRKPRGSSSVTCSEQTETSITTREHNQTCSLTELWVSKPDNQSCGSASLTIRAVGQQA